MGAQGKWPRLEGRSDVLKISASDAQDRPNGCGAHGALKVRPSLVAPDWSRRYDNSQPFLLGVIRDIATKLHTVSGLDSWEVLDAAITAELSQYPLHPGSRAYARHAIENYTDAHELINEVVGPLHFRLFDPQVAVGPNNVLSAWTPVYENGAGTREVRRLRFGSVRKTGLRPDRWTVVAAHVAALARPSGGVERVRVTEIGLGDGSHQVLFDGTPQHAQANYDELALPALREITAARSMTPGYSCKDCKIAGCCGTIEKFDGFLGQKQPGAGTRSVSARDIETYEHCAAQWHLSLSCHLPKENISGPASDRGRLIHHWIATAHSRSQKCSETDVGDFDSPTTFTSSLSAGEYLEVRDYLGAHVANCPLNAGAQMISIEAPVYGYDKSADVIVASEPDMIYVDADDALVIREVKTTAGELPKDNGEAFNRFFAVPWLLNLFGSGYRGPYDSDTARFELEVISQGESRLFTWDLRDAGILRMARAEVRLRAKLWHRDTTWASSPGKHCGWCPVRRWCPDSMTDEPGGIPADELSAGLRGESAE